MKNFVHSLAVFFVAFFAFTSFCHAADYKTNDNVKPLDAKRIALGGIQLGALPGHVRGIYGKPDSQKRYEKGDGSFITEWEYGGTVRICFAGSSPEGIGTVDCIVVTADNGFHTPDGLHVDMEASAIQATYGAPAWYDDNYYWYQSQSGQKLVFVLEEEKIVRICIGYYR